jgi:hypothetical protein
MGGHLDLMHQVLVSLAMLVQAGISKAAKEALFAAKVHSGELDEERDLVAEPGAAVTERQLLTDRVDRLDQDSVLVFHGLDAGNYARVRSNVGHGFPPETT